MTVTHLPTHAVETPPGSLTAMGVVHRAGITYRQLDYWARTGLLEPTIRSATGSGTQRLYSLSELHRAATLRWLLDAGLTASRPAARSSTTSSRPDPPASPTA